MQWIVENAGQISALPLLLIALYGLHKGWWVMGSTYQECVAERNKFETALENEARLAIDAKNDEITTLRLLLRKAGGIGVAL